MLSHTSRCYPTFRNLYNERKIIWPFLIFEVCCRSAQVTSPTQRAPQPLVVQHK